MTVDRLAVHKASCVDTASRTGPKHRRERKPRAVAFAKATNTIAHAGCDGIAAMIVRPAPILARVLVGILLIVGILAIIHNI